MDYFTKDDRQSSKSEKRVEKLFAMSKITNILVSGIDKKTSNLGENMNNQAVGEEL